MSNNETLNRLYKQDGNLLLNPFFELITPIDGRTGGGTDYDDLDLGRYTDRAGPLSVIPGWHAFGLSVQYSDKYRLYAADGVPPFAPIPTDLSFIPPSTAAGVQITSQPGYVQGICQKLPNGGRLAGRKVRVSGAYNIDPSNVNPDSGISIWLKGKVHVIEAEDTPHFTSVAGITDTAVPNRLADGTVDLTLPNQGDTLVVSKQNIVGLFEVDDPTALPNTVNTLQITDDLIDETWNVGPFAQHHISNGAHCVMPPTGVRIDHSAAGFIPGYVVRVSDTRSGGTEINEGPELHSRYFDTLWAVPNNLTSSPDQSNDAASFLMFGRYDVLGGNSGPDPDNGGGNVLDVDGWWQGAFPENLSGDPSLTLWLLDSDDWTNVAANGQVELFTEARAADTTVHYFEEVIEVPSDFDANTGAAWIIVMPYDPATQPHALGPGVVLNLYAVTLELLPEDTDVDGDPVAGRLMKNYVNRIYGAGLAAPDLRSALREPIWYPRRFHIDPAIFVQEGEVRPLAGAYEAFSSGLTSPSENTGLLLKGTDVEPIWIPIHGVPLGSIVTGLRMRWRGGDGGSGHTAYSFVSFELWQVFSKYDNPVSDNAQRQLLLSGFVTSPAPDTSGVVSTYLDGTDPNEVLRPINRHLVGKYSVLDYSSGDLDIGELVGAQLWLRVGVTSNNATNRLLLKPGRLEVMVDPRLARTQLWSGGWG